MKKFIISVVVIIVVLIVNSCVIIGNKTDFSSLFQEKITKLLVDGNPKYLDTILIIPLSGIIVSNASTQGLLSSKNIDPTKISLVLEFLSKQSNVKGIIFEINSPGGSASASEEIYQLILNFKKNAKIPIIMYCHEIVASGGYYISQAADAIMANPNALIGSVGVISIFFSAQKLIETKLEINTVVIKSGKFKDTGSLFRKMSEEEVKYWENIIMQSYDNFINVVSTGRKISKDDVRTIADGKLFIAKDALQYRLIDKIGTLQDAINLVSKMASLKNKYKALKLIKNSNLNNVSIGSSITENPFKQYVESILNLRGQLLYLSNVF